MIRQTTLVVLLVGLGNYGTLAFSPSTQGRCGSSTALGGQPLDRKSFGAKLLAVVPIVSLLPEIAKADVSDGTMLPQGAQQFQKALRLKTDIPKVRQRVANSAGEIDRAEWDNIGKFLRNAYATADDMKAVAAGIVNPDNQKRALQDVDQLKKYAQAGDVSVNKKDGPGFVAVVDKMQELVNDFFDSLSDVPDEI